MDANGQRFFMLAQRDDWGLGLPAELAWARSTLRLASRGQAVTTEDVTQAPAKLELVPQTVDTYGTYARWNAGARTVVAGGAGIAETVIWTAGAGQIATDLFLGDDGVLYVACEAAKQIVLVDRRARWADYVLSTGDFSPWRLARHPDGGVWVLDRKKQALARAHGLPLRPKPYPPYDPDVFRPNPEDPDPPALTLAPNVAWTAPETPVAIATSSDGTVAFLAWPGDPHANARVRFFDGTTLGDQYLELNNASQPFSLAWDGTDRVLVTLANVTEARAYDATEVGLARDPLGDYYPLPPDSWDGGPLVHAPEQPAYATTSEGPRLIYRLALPSYEPAAQLDVAQPFDSGDPRTVWHRLYLEAAIPPHCEVDVWLAATDDGTITPSTEWFPHRFGGLPADGNVPRAAWSRQASELPFGESLLPCAPAKDVTGLFTCLVQRAGKTVRSLRGRYLHVRLVLSGDGRSTPEIAALRAWASRFSYRDHYLPELYREFTFPPEADQAGAATPSDFLERFLLNFEGVLTPIEDRIASSWLLTDPRTTPDDALDWLASWIGFVAGAQLPPERQRAMLERASELYQQRGTLAGLSLALDLATGGLVTSGELVVLEDYRMRRTFATILGADLDEDNDPLMPGLISSGNSYVGATFFLGDQHNKEFLAMFGSQAQKTQAEANAVEALYEDLAFRATVFVQDDLDDATQAIVQHVIDAEKPAHVQVRLLTASRGFVVGLASLLGVNSYLRAPEPTRKPVILGESHLGADFLERAPSLDPRLGSEPLETAPVAVLNGDLVVPANKPFTLDGSGSYAEDGISDYIWTLVPQGEH